MSQLKRNIAQSLAAGQKPAEVAARLGVSASYISQLQNEDDSFKELYASMITSEQLNNHEQFTRIDRHYNQLEERLMETINENADLILGMYIDKPTALLQAIRTLNGAKRRGSGEAAPTQVQHTAVLQLPAFIVDASTPQVKHNGNNEVIEVAATPLVNMSTTAIRGQADEERSKVLSDLTAQAGKPSHYIDEATGAVEADRDTTTGELQAALAQLRQDTLGGVEPLDLSSVEDLF